MTSKKGLCLTENFDLHNSSVIVLQRIDLVYFVLGTRVGYKMVTIMKKKTEKKKKV